MRAQEGGPWETIVVDNHSNDGTLGVARTFTPHAYTFGPERSAQRNYGASKATSDLLVFIDSDMELTEGLLNECAEKLQRFDAVCLRECTITGGSYWTNVRAFEREAYFKSGTFEAARGFRHVLFAELGGYDENLTGLEDMDMQVRLLERTSQIGWVDRPVLHHEEGLSPIDYLRKRHRYGLTDSTFARKHPGYWMTLRSPFARTRLIMSHCRGRPVLSTLATLAGLLVMRTAESVVRLTFLTSG